MNPFQRWLSADPSKYYDEQVGPDYQAKAYDIPDLLRDMTAAASSGENVTFDRALQSTVVMACARVIAEGLSVVPCKVFRTSASGGREEARDHPLYKLLHRSPNAWQTSFEFREQLGLHLTLTNNAYVFINRDSKGYPLELLAYEPGQVEVIRNGYDTQYFIKVKNGRGAATKVEIPAINMWHLRGPSINGWLGLDAVKYAREAIGLSLATEKFGAKLFNNAAKPFGVLSSDQTLKPDQVINLKESWDLQHNSNNPHATAVLGNGMKFQAVSLNPDESQFLQTRKFQIEEVCRAFRVLPVMVMHTDGSGSAYKSLTELQLQHVTNTLAPWFERFEQSAEINLLSDDERDNKGYSIKLISQGLLKGSSTERASYYKEMISIGVMTRNEARTAEDWDRIDDPLADSLTPAANLFGPAQATEKPTGDNIDE
jgi:HK97 family phage portal protein